MTELQKESVEIAKDLSQLETNQNWASGELSKLKGELAALEARNIPKELPVGGEVYVALLMLDVKGTWIDPFVSQNPTPAIQTSRFPIYPER